MISFFGYIIFYALLVFIGLMIGWNTNDPQWARDVGSWVRNKWNSLIENVRSNSDDS